METKRLAELNSFPTNDYEAEQIFRTTCSWYESKFSNPEQISSQAHQKYINNYHKAKSFKLIFKDWDDLTYLFVYDTESEREDIKILGTPLGLNYTASITLLPNGELFCLCKLSNQGKALIIDNNHNFRFLPSDLHWSNSSAIYFNTNIFCFGGIDKFPI